MVKRRRRRLDGVRESCCGGKLGEFLRYDIILFLTQKVGEYFLYFRGLLPHIQQMQDNKNEFKTKTIS